MSDNKTNRLISALMLVGASALGIGITAAQKEGWDQKVSRLSAQIVDPAVSPAQLQQLGFYTVTTHGPYIDSCREKVTGAFNKKMTPDEQFAAAQDIDACIYNRGTLPPKQ